jgi:succinoglycan biosynthesis protein ExoA
MLGMSTGPTYETGSAGVINGIENMVSVILTVLNEGETLGALLDALLAQSLRPDEIVLVDGGSSDGTVDLLRRYAGEHPEIRYYVEPGANIARGRNIAIARAHGDLIAVTDAGCLPDRDWLRELLAPFGRDPDIAAVGGRIVPVAETRFEYYCGMLSTPDVENESQAGMFYGRSSAFRRQVFERIGGYPEWLYTAEDTLFALRAGRQGFRVAYAPESRLYWRPRPTLRKMARMFYLYGRGNGRIQWGELSGCLYWLRYYLLGFGTLLAGFLNPWFWLASGAVFLYLGRLIVLPNLRRVGAVTRAADRYCYVPLIVLTRNLFSNLGFLAGTLEYRHVGIFKRRLEGYMK